MYHRFGKRLLDVSVAAVLLVVCAPLLLGLALWIKGTSRGPVCYRGPRVGRDGQLFWMLKFRTMVHDADGRGPSSTAADDERITAAGRWLRRFKLDELPQLLNVLKGEMSLVGPRPQVEWAVAEYSDREKRLLTVRPGITDWASIRFRNEGEILKGSADPDGDYLRLIHPQKLALSLKYVDAVSLGTDLRILLRTAGIVLGARGEE